MDLKMSFFDSDVGRDKDQKENAEPEISSSRKAKNKSAQKPTSSKNVPCSADDPVKPPPDMSKLVANPKTVKERKANAELLKMANADHTDDIFNGKKNNPKKVGTI